MSECKKKNFMKPRWTRPFGILLGLLTLFLFVQPVFAVISPEYLKNGRTYDQENAYFNWNGSVGYVSIYHRDNTSLPPSEGGTNCGSGCTETVTRIYNGGSVSGNFTYLNTFNVQVAYTGDSAVGTAIVKACGQTIWIRTCMYLAPVRLVSTTFHLLPGMCPRQATAPGRFRPLADMSTFAQLRPLSVRPLRQLLTLR